MKWLVKILLIGAIWRAEAQPIQICMKMQNQPAPIRCSWRNDPDQALQWVLFCLDSVRAQGHFTAWADTSANDWTIHLGPIIPVIDTGDSRINAFKNGFLLAHEKYSIVNWNQDTLVRIVSLELGNKPVWGTIDMGDAAAWLNPIWLQKYLGVRPNAPALPKSASLLNNKLASLPFCTQQVPPELIQTSDGKLNIRCLLQQKKSNQFDGILALANQPEPDGRNSLKITGEFQALGSNWLRNGSQLEFTYRGLADGQQAKFEWSNAGISYWPLGSAVSLQWYRRDTTQVMSDLKIGLDYRFGVDQWARFAWGQRTWATPDTVTRYFPVSFRVVEQHWDTWHQKGWEVDAEIWKAVGRFGWNAKAQRIWGKGMYWKTSFQTKTAGLQGLKLEELRVGGLESWRGLDEGQLKAKQWAWIQAEQRWYFEPTSYGLGFIQYGKTNDKTIVSTGLGAVIQVPQGWLTLMIAAAQINQQWQSRVHIGLKLRPF